MDQEIVLTKLNCIWCWESRGVLLLLPHGLPLTFCALPLRAVRFSRGKKASCTLGMSIFCKRELDIEEMGKLRAKGGDAAMASQEMGPLQ